jgi:ABC-type phosphate/phosphonate transport system permease subunit
MKDDMSNTDWLIGKGIAGEYYCPNIDVNDVTGYRSVVETGFLQIMLKGGAISLGLLLLIAIPAFVLGIFYSKNILSKACGMWILLWVLYLYPTVPNSFHIHFLLFWMGVGICYSKKIRNLPESVLTGYFKQKDALLKEVFI